MSTTATIADIARQAGVGTATVDRVLNKRPGVNAETVQRVMEVVALLGAPPQRGRPRKGENFRFAFVLPADPTPFNEMVERLIAQAAGEFRHQHITEVTHRIDATDAAAFAAGLGQLGDCDGIAVMAPRRVPIIADLPTTGEQGLPGVEASVWNAFFLPKGTPDPIVRKLGKAIDDTLDNPGIRKRLEDLGLEITPPRQRGPEFLAKFLPQEIERWAKPIREAGISVD